MQNLKNFELELNQNVREIVQIQPKPESRKFAIRMQREYKAKPEAH